MAGNNKLNPNIMKKNVWHCLQQVTGTSHSFPKRTARNLLMEVYNLSIMALLRAMFVHYLSFPVT
jgi:hypothetical protein